MPTYTPRKAERVQLKLRMAIAGPSRSGKTLNSLQFAGTLGTRICVIDTDHGNAEKFLGRPHIPDFDVIVLDAYTPQDYLDAIAAAAGYDVLVVDTVSKEWLATLAIKDEATERSPSQNAYTVGWRAATPGHDAFVAALLAFPGHLIVTLREKVKYVLEKNDRGQLEPKKVGMTPIQRAGFEFEFDVLCELDMANTMTVEARLPEIHGLRVRKPTPEFMDPIKTWLGTGRRVYSLKEIGEAVRATGLGEAELKAQMLALAPGVTSYGQLTTRQREDLYLYFAGLMPTVAAVADASMNGHEPEERNACI